MQPSVNFKELERRPSIADLEFGSYPDETLSTEPLTRSVCKESLGNPDSDSGDSERGPNGDERGLGSPVCACLISMIHLTFYQLDRRVSKFPFHGPSECDPLESSGRSIAAVRCSSKHVLDSSCF